VERQGKNRKNGTKAAGIKGAQQKGIAIELQNRRNKTRALELNLSDGNGSNEVYTAN